MGDAETPVEATPAAAAAADEAGVDVADVTGTGAEGRVLVSDVAEHVAAGSPKAAELTLVKGDDGSVYLVGVFEGARLELAHVNASQVAGARVQQGLEPALPNATNVILGAPSDQTPTA